MLTNSATMTPTCPSSASSSSASSSSASPSTIPFGSGGGGGGGGASTSSFGKGEEKSRAIVETHHKRDPRYSYSIVRSDPGYYVEIEFYTDPHHYPHIIHRCYREDTRTANGLPVRIDLDYNIKIGVETDEKKNQKDYEDYENQHDSWKYLVKYSSKYVHIPVPSMLFCNLGRCFEKGSGVEKDMEQAAYYYEQAANHGDTPCRSAQYLLGRCYENGTGVKKDLELAMHYYHLAAKNGYTLAQIRLQQRHHETEEELKDRRELQDEKAIKPFLENIDRWLEGTSSLALVQPLYLASGSIATQARIILDWARILHKNIQCELIGVTCSVSLEQSAKITAVYEAGGWKSGIEDIQPPEGTQVEVMIEMEKLLADEYKDMQKIVRIVPFPTHKRRDGEIVSLAPYEFTQGLENIAAFHGACNVQNNPKSHHLPNPVLVLQNSDTINREGAPFAIGTSVESKLIPTYMTDIQAALTVAAHPFSLCLPSQRQLFSAAQKSETSAAMASASSSSSTAASPSTFFASSSSSGSSAVSDASNTTSPIPTPTPTLNISNSQ